MNSLARLYPGDDAVRLAISVLAQVAGIVILAFAASWILARRNAALRDGIWRSALALVCAAPLLAWGFPRAGIAVWRSAARHAELRAPPRDMIDLAVEDLPPVVNRVEHAAEIGNGPMSKSNIAPRSHTDPTIGRGDDRETVVERPTIEAVVGAVTAIWATVGIVLLARLIAGLRAVARLRCDLTPMIDLPHSVAERLGITLGVERLPPIMLSRRFGGPASMGLWQPVVVLPANLASRMSANELHDALAHECAHALRRDTQVALVQQIVAALYWFNPLVHVLNRQLARAREEVCDNAVLVRTKATDYARTLLALSQAVQSTEGCIAVVPMFDRRWRLARRVAGILSTRRMIVTRMSRNASALVAVMAVTLGIALAAICAAADDPKDGQTRPAPEAGSPDPHRHRESIGRGQIYDAISKGVAFLKNGQDAKTGTWPDHGFQIGGITALATLAMLNCGAPVDDPAIKRSLDYLRALKPATTYVASLQTMVFCSADPQKDRPLIERNVKWLEETQIKAGVRSGSWSYPGLAVGGDNSNSHFAMMALFEAQRAGVKISAETWQRAGDYWKGAQDGDGGFGYYKAVNVPATGSMTCAGISSLAIASAMQPNTDAALNGEQIKCCGGQSSNDFDERVQRALTWLVNNFSLEQNPQRGARGAKIWHYYYLWGLEHSCRLTGERRIGNHGWYREGSAYLCGPNERNSDGHWQGSAGIEADPNIATSLALLFLGEGRRPVIISKLRYGQGGDWNHHRQDVANLVHLIEDKWRSEFPLGLSWQTIDIARASADDLLESPILFITGSEAPEIGDKAAVLREYIDRGGFIFAEADCPDSEKFDRGFRGLLKKILPDGAELKPLVANHRIWSAEEAVPAEKRPTLLGIDFDGRTRILYSPPSKAGGAGLSCCWELASLGDVKSIPPAVAGRIATAKSIGLNFIAYATGRKLRTRDE